MKMNMNNIKNLVAKKWSGGVTHEIYRDQEEFNIRISCAEIYPGESAFSDFTGYKRILKILENDVILERNSDGDSNEKICLDKNNIFIFDGSDKIKSKNEALVLDFNVIYKSDYYRVSFEEVNGYYCSIDNQERGKVLIFSLKENSILVRDKSESNDCDLSSCKLNNSELKFEKYDFLLSDYLDSYKLNGNFIIVKFLTKL